jgi:hypothetical protein
MNKSLMLLKQEFESSSGLTPEFDNFSRVFMSEFRSFVKKDLGVSDVKLSRGHFEVSGFFKMPSGQVWYISLGDVRWNKDKMMLRTAKGFNDYTGGMNQFVEVSNPARFKRDVEAIVRR